MPQRTSRDTHHDSLDICIGYRLCRRPLEIFQPKLRAETEKSGLGALKLEIWTLSSDGTSGARGARGGQGGRFSSPKSSDSSRKGPSPSLASLRQLSPCLRVDLGSLPPNPPPKKIIDRIFSNLSVCLSGWLSVCLSVCLAVCLCVCVCIFLCQCVCVFLCMCLYG